MSFWHSFFRVLIQKDEDDRMIKIAVYGKGGIGKSTTVSNVSAALSDMGYKVMQIGCDPKADSTVNLHGKEKVETVLDLVRTKKNTMTLEDMVTEGYGGVICVEAGGPTPGLGCAGRGIIAALEKLAEKGAYDVYKPDMFFMMYWVMWSAADFPCRCAEAMRIRCL